MQKASCPSEIQTENRQGNQKGGRKREEGGEGGDETLNWRKKLCNSNIRGVCEFENR